MIEKVVDYELIDDVAVISLNHPTSSNAMSRTMGPQLMQCIQRAEQEARALLLTSEGKHFCSGANLTDGNVDLNDSEIDMGEWLEKLYNPMILKLRNLPIPFITAVKGAAVGLGCSFALLGDIIVAGRGSFFHQSFCKVGLVPDGGSAYLLAKAVGRVKAMELMLLGERYPAEQAFQDGLITRLVEDDQVDSTAMELAAGLAAGPTLTLTAIRRSAWASLDGDLATQLDRERIDQCNAGRTKDFQEGVAAFKEKRKPIFTAQ